MHEFSFEYKKTIEPDFLKIGTLQAEILGGGQKGPPTAGMRCFRRTAGLGFRMNAVTVFLLFHVKQQPKNEQRQSFYFFTSGSNITINAFPVFLLFQKQTAA